MEPTTMRSRPQMYSQRPFHIIRAIAFVSAAIVSGILIYFCLQLKHDGFKLPWTFIIVLASSLLSLISLALTGVLFSCFFLSPLLNLILNTTIFVFMVVGYGLLTWNITGTLGHTCSRANWASDDGMMICRTYKAFYAFEVFGLLAQVALIVLDLRSRHAQTKSGRYGKMGDVAAKGGRDVKLDDLHHRSVGVRPGMHDHTESHDSIPYGVEHNDSRARLRDNVADVGYGQAPPMRMEDFRNDSQTSGYSYNSTSYVPQSGYGNSGYGYGPQR